MKKSFLFLCILLCSFLSFGANVNENHAEEKKSRAIHILHSSFRKFRKMSFVGKIENPVLKNSFRIKDYKTIGIPEFTSQRVYRKCDKNGDVSFQTELYTKEKKLFATVIYNRDGGFLVFERSNSSNKGTQIAVMGGAYPLAFCVDNPILDIPDEEARIAAFDMSDVRFLGEECYHITVSLENVPAEYFEKYLVKGSLRRNVSESMELRPIFREYIIGKESGFIYSFRFFNSNGSLINGFQYTSFDMEFDWTQSNHLFETPSNVIGYCDDEDEAFEMLISYARGNSKRNSFQTGFLSLLFEVKTQFINSLFLQIFSLICIGVIFVGTGVWIRMKRK